jgi:hypothetical protein
MARRKRIKRAHMKRFASDNVQVHNRIVPYHIRNITRDHYRHLVEMGKPDPVADKIFPQEPIRQHIVLVNMRSKQIFLYWNNDYTQFYFVKVVFKVCLKSISYPDREYAMRQYNLGRVVWTERKTTPELAIPSPSPPASSG